MNKCMNSEIQEMLSDLLHGALGADARGRVEAHLATCEECREELEILRTFKSAAVFAPMINVDRVVRQIPPYRTIAPATDLPARPRLVSWLVAAGVAIAIFGVGSLFVARQNVTPTPAAVVIAPPSVQVPIQPTVPAKTPEPATSLGTVVSIGRPHTHALALAADVDGLSDRNLLQLMNEMTRFDALPATEPDPVISVDSGY